MDAAARELMDRLWDYVETVDDHRPMWESDIEQIERWPTTSESHTASVIERCLTLRDEALQRAEAHPDDAPSLRTAADVASLMAAELDTQIEQSLAHPSLGLHSYFYWAINNYPLQTPEHGRRYLDKMAGLPGAVEQLTERLTAAAADGQTMLVRHVTTAISKLDDHLASDLTDDPLLAQPPPTQLGDGDAEAWRGDLADAIRTHVRPSLQRLRDVLRDHVAPAGRPDEKAGMLHLPGGDERYAALVEGFTSEGVTPEQVHQTGLEQVERLAGEYRELGASVLGTSDLDEVFSRLRDDPELHFQTAEQVVEAATRLHARAQERAPSWFLSTPTAPCEARATEHGSLAFYSPPAQDGSRPGVFFFNTADPTMWGPQFAATVFHEGIPGHHFQLALARERDDLHDLHRNAFLAAFGEGWALYTERLADEMGLYPTDTDRLGMLVSDSLRACRLVVDTGLHAKGWSRQQAIDYVLANSPLGPVEVTAEIDRYIGMPGQATSYMWGRLEIQRLREESEQLLGPAFDLPTFHDVVLSQGMVSLPALRVMVERWRAGVVDRAG